MVSKELLSEVLGYKVWKVLGHDYGTNQLRFCIYPNKGDVPSEYTFPINIHELAHKCKEWAFEQRYTILELGKWRDSERESYLSYSVIAKSFDTPLSEAVTCSYDNRFHANTGVEVIFQACQWILENKDK